MPVRRPGGPASAAATSSARVTPAGIQSFQSGTFAMQVARGRSDYHGVPRRNRNGNPSASARASASASAGSKVTQSGVDAATCDAVGGTETLRRRSEVLMEYDVQLFDVNRAQYRKVREIVTGMVTLVLVYSFLNAIAEPLCLTMYAVDEGGNCTLTGPMSCLTSTCQDVGMWCHQNNECVCPDLADTCNMSSLAVVDFCPHDNHTFAAHYMDCPLTDGLTLLSIVVQVVTLVPFAVVYCLFVRRVCQHKPEGNEVVVGFFRSMQRFVVALGFLCCAGKTIAVAYSIFYARIGVSWNFWSDLVGALGSPAYVAGLKDTFDSFIGIYVQSLGAAFLLAGPVTLFVQILRRLPAQVWSITCHHVWLGINIVGYLAVRIGFGILNGQTFGWIPFAYVISVLQVCVEEVPVAVVNEYNYSRAFIYKQYMDIDFDGGDHPAYTAGDDDYYAFDDDAPWGDNIRISSCTDAPSMLWVGVAGVFLWETLIAVHIYAIRHSIENAILKVPYPEYRAIILYFRFVDAMWRLLVWVSLLLSMPMALANKSIFRYAAWQGVKNATEIGAEVIITPLTYIGATVFAGSSLDVFCTFWTFGLMFLHLPRFYSGSIMEAFCGGKQTEDDTLDDDNGNPPSSRRKNRFEWGRRQSSTHHLRRRISLNTAALRLRARASSSNFAKKLVSRLSGRAQKPVSIDELPSLDRRDALTAVHELGSSSNLDEGEQRGNSGEAGAAKSTSSTAATVSALTPADSYGELGSVHNSIPTIHSDADVPALNETAAGTAAAASSMPPLVSETKEPTSGSTDGKPGGGSSKSLQPSDAGQVGATGTPPTGPAAGGGPRLKGPRTSHPGQGRGAVKISRMTTMAEHESLANSQNMKECLPPGGLDCFIDIVYADFIKEIVRIFNKLEYDYTKRDYLNDQRWHAELRETLGEERYQQFSEDHTTLQVIRNASNKNHCWMFDSAPQEGLVIVFPGSANLQNYLNALALRAIPWESFLDWQLRKKQISKEVYKKQKRSRHAQHHLATKVPSTRRASATEASTAAASARNSFLRAGTVGTGQELFQQTSGEFDRAISLHGLASMKKRRRHRQSHILEEVPSAPADCRVHEGFFSMYKSLRSKVIAGVREHLARYRDDCKITVTGHSLGGVLCAFLALDLVELGIVKNLERIHVSLYGSPCMGNIKFKEYYDSLLTATLQFGMWNDPILMYPPQPCNVVYWHCVGKDVILLPAAQYLVEPSQLELYFIQLGRISSQAHRRFTYYQAILKLLLDPDSANSITDVSLEMLQRYLWSLQLVVRRTPPEMNEFYAEFLPEYVGDAVSLQTYGSSQESDEDFPGRGTDESEPV